MAVDEHDILKYRLMENASYECTIRYKHGFPGPFRDEVTIRIKPPDPELREGDVRAVYAAGPGPKVATAVNKAHTHCNGLDSLTIYRVYRNR